ncbi:MAG: hypothetical protein R2705_04465 [Ilumatobacteraceae bacterium]
MAELEAWLPHLPPAVPVSTSHLSVEAFERLADRSGRPLQLRVGTALWHARRDALRLGADVLEVRPVAAGERCGYRQTPAAADGHLVMIGAGTAHGVHPLPDGRSPFHFARTRLALIEPPHMHTSMVLVPDGDPTPRVGEVVDVQRPLTQTVPDRIVWIR